MSDDSAMIWGQCFRLQTIGPFLRPEANRDIALARSIATVFSSYRLAPSIRYSPKLRLALFSQYSRSIGSLTTYGTLRQVGSLYIFGTFCVDDSLTSFDTLLFDGSLRVLWHLRQ